MDITGQTSIMFILCDPVHHVRGSDILNKRFEAVGEDVAISPLHVFPEDLGHVVHAIRRMNNVKGFGVTIPHKINIIDHLDDLTELAKLVGSVNFVRRNPDGTLSGDNVDGGGFIAGLGADGIEVRGRSVLQVGAGGAGRATAFALADAGARRLHIANRTMSKATELAAAVAVAAAHPDCVVEAGVPDLADFDLVVNATSSGMLPDDPLPFDVRRLRDDAAVADIIIKPRMTRLLEAAQERGLRISFGQSMLDGQFELARSFIGPFPQRR